MAGDAVATWRVTSQVQDYGRGPDGKAVEGYRVTFTTDRGNTGTVFVPMAQYTVEQVRQLVGQMAAQMDSVSLLIG